MVINPVANSTLITVARSRVNIAWLYFVSTEENLVTLFMLGSGWPRPTRDSLYPLVYLPHLPPAFVSCSPRLPDTTPPASAQWGWDSPSSPPSLLLVSEMIPQHYRPISGLNDCRLWPPLARERRTASAWDPYTLRKRAFIACTHCRKVKVSIMRGFAMLSSG